VPCAAPDDRADAGLRGASPVTVLVVDDQESFRTVMRELVGGTEGFRLVGEAASGEAALVAADELSPRMVIMDKRMPGMGGIEATRALTASHPELVVVLVSAEDPDVSLIRSCGAAAFVRKRDLSPNLLREMWRNHRI
jgi:two-component system invasion response regulator UvrY